MSIANAAHHSMMGGKKWVNPYVADGLVAMWDGEWNAGPGVHDPTATTFTELISGTKCALAGSLSTSYEWTDKSLIRRLENSGYFLYDASGVLLSAMRSATFTLECTTSRPIQSATWQAQIVNIAEFVTSGYSTGLIARWRRESDGRTGNLSGAPYSSGGGYTLASADALSTFCVAYDRGAYRSYNDGEQKSTGSPTPFDSLTAVIIRLGSVAYGFRGHYHALRLYNRALTAQEIISNYAVDAARFSLPTT